MCADRLISIFASASRSLTLSLTQKSSCSGSNTRAILSCVRNYFLIRIYEFGSVSCCPVGITRRARWDQTDAIIIDSRIIYKIFSLATSLELFFSFFFVEVFFLLAVLKFNKVNKRLRNDFANCRTVSNIHSLFLSRK